jgi:hypothetical protein
MSIAAAGLLVDPRAEAAFEAPKRFAALLAIVVATLAVLALPRLTAPEFSSYRAERRLYAASALFRSLIAEGNAAAGQTAMLDLVAASAMQAAEVFRTTPGR